MTCRLINEGTTDVAGVSSRDAAVRATSASVASDVARNVLPEGRLFVVVLDDALIPLDPKAVAETKKIGTELIAHLTPSDQMAVVFTAHGQDSEAFTTDAARLQAAFNRFSPGFAMWKLGMDGPVQIKIENGRAVPVPNLDMDGHFYEGSIRTVSDVVDSVAENPDRRKIVIYVTTGVPIDAALLSPQLASGTGRGVPNQELHRRLTDDVVALFRHAQLANVSLYTVDPMGLGGFEAYLRQRQPPLPASVVDNATRIAMDYLVEAAANTGGRAIVNTNDLGPGLASIFAENHSYYLWRSRGDRSGHRQVSPSRGEAGWPGVEVHTRVGYYASDTAAKAKEAASRIAAPLTSAIAGVMPQLDYPLRP